MENNNNIATVRTAAAATWAFLFTALISWWLDLDATVTAAIVSVVTVIINRVGIELQQTSNRWAQMAGDILLLVDKTPTYTPPPPPEG